MLQSTYSSFACFENPYRPIIRKFPIIVILLMVSPFCGGKPTTGTEALAGIAGNHGDKGFGGLADNA
jgi:hypothetical protein